LGEPPLRAVGLSATSPSRFRFAHRFGGFASIPLAHGLRRAFGAKISAKISANFKYVLKLF
jgi:hypothetical protein